VQIVFLSKMTVSFTKVAQGNPSPASRMEKKRKEKRKEFQKDVCLRYLNWLEGKLKFT
jgi:hypothetical protein